MCMEIGVFQLARYGGGGCVMGGSSDPKSEIILPLKS